MIVLDTDVVSALMREHPDAKVLRWINAQPATAAPQREAKRRDAIAADAMFVSEFANRIPAFGSDAARISATIAVTRRPISAFDAQIAAITRANDADLATRNVDDFDGCGIEIIDPWR